MGSAYLRGDPPLGGSQVSSAGLDPQVKGLVAREPHGRLPVTELTRWLSGGRPRRPGPREAAPWISLGCWRCRAAGSRITGLLGFWGCRGPGSGPCTRPSVFREGSAGPGRCRLCRSLLQACREEAGWSPGAAQALGWCSAAWCCQPEMAEVTEQLGTAGRENAQSPCRPHDHQNTPGDSL